MDDLAQRIRTELTRASGLDAELTPLVYEQMRGMAARMFARERADHTLQPTALVNEAWLKIAPEWDGDDDGGEEARGRFLGIATRAMRQVLIDHARIHGAQKRKAEGRRVTLGEPAGPHTFAFDRLLDLQDAMEELERSSPELSRIAELRLFGGLSTADASKALAISVATGKNRWALARTLLTRCLADPDWLDK